MGVRRDKTQRLREITKIWLPHKVSPCIFAHIACRATEIQSSVSLTAQEASIRLVDTPGLPGHAPGISYVCHIPSIAAGAIPSTVHNERAIRRVGSERPEI